MGREQKGGRKGVGRGKKGTFARKPVDFEKHPLVLTVEFIHLYIDNIVTELKSQ